MRVIRFLLFIGMIIVKYTFFWNMQIFNELFSKNLHFAFFLQNNLVMSDFFTTFAV